MVYCGTTSTAGLACFRKGIGVGRGLISGNPKLNLPKSVKGKTKRDVARDKELERVRKELVPKPRIIKIKVKKKKKNKGKNKRANKKKS